MPWSLHSAYTLAIWLSFNNMHLCWEPLSRQLGHQSVKQADNYQQADPSAGDFSAK
jgi:hypothetical protein